MFEPQPGRTSLVTRIEGTDPDAPSLLLMGHTDVVPVNPDGWSRDPFGAEIVDGFVWGRGAVDMLNLTASQAVAFRRLADSGFKPKGTLIYLAVADEEAQGVWGAHWLLDHERDAVYADYVLTESGGFQVPTPNGTRLPVLVGEKGTFWSKLTVRGTPGHGSQPFRTDNALVTAAEVVRRISSYEPETQIHGAWRQYIEGLGLDPEMSAALLDPDQFMGALAEMPVGMARQWHACTHTTFAPTIAHGGTKTNVIPDRVDLEVDVRTLPGQTGADAIAMMRDALGDLADAVEIESNDDPATESPMDTPLWDTLARRHVAHVRGVRARPRVHGGRHRQPVLPPRRRGRVRLRALLPAPRPTRTTAPCSTATTNASTRSRWRCRRRCGKPWPTTCSTADSERGACAAVTSHELGVDRECARARPHEEEHRHEQGGGDAEVEGPAVDPPCGRDRDRPCSPRGSAPRGG